MEKEITVVTAFFNINRQNWSKFERTEDQYFDYFTGWAKLRNKIIVYTQTENMTSIRSEATARHLSPSAFR